MNRLRSKASLVEKREKEQKDKEKGDELGQDEHKRGIEVSPPGTARSFCAPWEASEPALHLQPKLVKKKSSVFSLRKSSREVAREEDSPPPVPAIPGRYKMLPVASFESSDIPLPPPFSKVRHEPGCPPSGMFAGSSISPPTPPSRYVPLVAPYSTPVKSSSQVNLAPSIKNKSSGGQQPPQTRTKYSLFPKTRVNPGDQHKASIPQSTSHKDFAHSTDIVAFEGQIASSPSKSPSTSSLLHTRKPTTADQHTAYVPLPSRELILPNKRSVSASQQPGSLLPSPSQYSFSTVTPFSYHQHEVPYQAPIVPPSPYENQAATASAKTIKRLTNSPPRRPNQETAYPKWGPLSEISVPEATRKSSSSSSRSESRHAPQQLSTTAQDCTTSATSALGRSSGRRSGSGNPNSSSLGRPGIKAKKSLTSLFKRSSPSPAPPLPRITRPVLVPQPNPSTGVPALPATVSFAKPDGPPPERPERPELLNSAVMEVQRGRNTRLVLPLSGRSGGSGGGGGGGGQGGLAGMEQYRAGREGRHAVEGREEQPGGATGMWLRDGVTGERQFVKDI
ncbi:hypothetical protein N0V90_001817 [Kalmusia sp. IMI 367209]|nr:hypothetical protein N0V90_001817 [Kalmusia sp. IMI 367209]